MDVHAADTDEQPYKKTCKFALRQAKTKGRVCWPPTDNDFDKNFLPWIGDEDCSRLFAFCFVILLFHRNK